MIHNLGVYNIMTSYTECRQVLCVVDLAAGGLGVLDVDRAPVSSSIGGRRSAVPLDLDVTSPRVAASGIDHFDHEPDVARHTCSVAFTMASTMKERVLLTLA